MLKQDYTLNLSKSPIQLPILQEKYEYIFTVTRAYFAMMLLGPNWGPQLSKDLVNKLGNIPICSLIPQTNGLAQLDKSACHASLVSRTTKGMDRLEPVKQQKQNLVEMLFLQIKLLLLI